MASDFSIDDELERLDEIKNRASHSSCKGNILDECMQEGLRDSSRYLEDEDVDYAVIGGIGTQLEAYAVGGMSSVRREFEHRSTDDIDDLVRDRNSALQALHDNEYYNGVRPDVHIVEDGPIPGYREVVDEARRIDFEGFEVSIPQPEDAVYTKVADPNLLERDSEGVFRLEKKPGTFYDLEKMSDAGMFDIDEARLRDRVKELGVQPQDSLDVLRRAGFDL
ncbi:hypothetical protein GKQ38_03500 [Candidatus Nanohaloarchaea archaeon]|nr:hypothetical protein GKQ38_03500 [Candidatus Nanohaloarchaea archaeon]